MGFNILLGDVNPEVVDPERTDGKSPPPVRHAEKFGSLQQ